MENSIRPADTGRSTRPIEAPHPLEDQDPQQQLEKLRAELDEIDSDLLEIVRRRIEVCCRIAVLKRRHSIPMLQPARMGLVHDHARSYARSHQLSPDFLDDLYDVLIAETCRVEDLIIDGAGTGGATPLHHDG
ncbi:chorismate mutase family protein [Rhodococcus kronopolitis]|uniref:Chorismate mutase family protein n=1 Tax=Rhodococcus kronopolitis TaxID=1460226 RepID=A0ABV9FTW5_9NOCA